MFQSAFAWFAGENLPVFIGLTLALLIAACEAGFRLASSRVRRHPNREHEREVVGTVTASMLGLLSFTLGLTIGYAQDKAETRRGLVVHEAAAITTAWLRAKLVPSEEGPAIAGLIEELADVELAFTSAPSTEAEAGLIARREALQARIWSLAQSVARNQPTPVTTGMNVAVNEMFNAALAQRFAFGSKVPPTLSGMLLLASLLAIGALGYQLGLTGIRHPVLVALLLAMWTGGMAFVSDLNQPRLGSIRVDPAPLIWTIQGFTAPLPSN
jgi:hypothetical protein